MAESDFDQTVEQYHLAIGSLIKGNPEPQHKVWSHREDVTLANPVAPFGPVSSGWEQVAETMKLAASNFTDGESLGFDRIATYPAADMMCIVEIERSKLKLAGTGDMARATIRVTSLFRLEDGAWKLVHRHADSVTSPRSIESAIEK
jgi:ketosteroid isomerase-like protein